MLISQYYSLHNLIASIIICLQAPVLLIWDVTALRWQPITIFVAQSDYDMFDLVGGLGFSMLYGDLTVKDDTDNSLANLRKSPTLVEATYLFHHLPVLVETDRMSETTEVLDSTECLPHFFQYSHPSPQNLYIIWLDFYIRSKPIFYSWWTIHKFYRKCYVLGTHFVNYLTFTDLIPSIFLLKFLAS